MTYSQILQLSSAPLNDTARDKFTDIVLLPYLNIARMELEEIFELNDIPSTSETSSVITVPAGVTAVGFSTTPALPANLVEIQQLWESETGQDRFVPVTKKDYLTSNSLWNTQISKFGVWAWMDEEIRVLPSIVAVDIKIDYIQSLFAFLAIGDLGGTNNILNTSNFLQYRVAALASEFIDENKTRADALNGDAGAALERSLGISIKGMQSIVTRRRPFRASFKRTRTVF